jgi:Domain of unknown function (DUF4214)
MVFGMLFGTHCVVRVDSARSRRRSRANGKGKSKMKRIMALPVAVVAICLSMSSVLRADTTAENTNFIDKAYLDLLQRPASPTDIANGLLLLGSESRYQFALMLDTRTEYYQLLVESYIPELLGRPATPTDLAGLTGLFSSSSDEFVQAQIAGSSEFFLDSGSTDAGFVTALYKDFLNRTPSSSEKAFWVSALSTKSRDTVALEILGLAEYDKDLVASYYLQYLRRAADPTGLADFANAINGGTQTDEQVIATMIGSDEYFNLAQPPPAAPTPEPKTAALLGLGLAALILLRRHLPT